MSINAAQFADAPFRRAPVHFRILSERNVLVLLKLQGALVSICLQAVWNLTHFVVGNGQI